VVAVAGDDQHVVAGVVHADADAVVLPEHDTDPVDAPELRVWGFEDRVAGLVGWAGGPSFEGC
jgi:hypothetical protein